MAFMLSSLLDKRTLARTRIYACTRAIATERHGAGVGRPRLRPIKGRPGALS